MLPKDLKPEEIPDEIELDRLEAELSLHSFLKQAWHVVEPATRFVPGKHIEMVPTAGAAVQRVSDEIVEAPEPIVAMVREVSNWA